jgi:hypothetical protein
VSSLVLVCAAAGSQLTNALAKASESPLWPSTCLVRDVEETALDIANADRQKKGLSLFKSTGDFVASHTKQTVVIAWQSALRSILGEISLDTTSRRYVLACHTTLFSPVRLEFYSPVDPLIFNEFDLAIERVIILIDDVYDMHTSLGRSAGSLWADHEKSPFYEMKAKTADEHTVVTLQFEQKLRWMTQLLGWRRSEMIQAETLARQLSTKATVLGVKHSADALATLVSSPNNPTVYFSHKITQPRFDFSFKGHAWPNYVSEFNSLHSKLIDLGSVGLMPTAIDELRFAPPGAGGPYSRTNEIGLRWPLPGDRPVMYVPPDENGPEYSNFSSEQPEIQTQLSSAMLTLFEGIVFDEIAFRDHYIVANSDGVLLHRPLWFTGLPSGGAHAEMMHWEELWEENPSRFSIIFHTLDDVILLFQRDLLLRKPSSLRERLVRLVDGFLKEKIGLNERQLDVLQDLDYQIPAKDSGLRPILKGEHLTRFGIEKDTLDEAVRVSVAKFLFTKLAFVSRPSDRVLVILEPSHDRLVSKKNLKLVKRAIEGRTSLTDSEALYTSLVKLMGVDLLVAGRNILAQAPMSSWISTKILNTKVDPARQLTGS